MAVSKQTFLILMHVKNRKKSFNNVNSRNNIAREIMKRKIIIRVITITVSAQSGYHSFVSITVSAAKDLV